MARYQLQTRQYADGAWLGAGTEGTEVTYSKAMRGQGFTSRAAAIDGAQAQSARNVGTMVRVLDTRTGAVFGECGDSAEFDRMAAVIRTANAELAQQPSIARVATLFNCTPEQVRAQYSANAKDLRGMASKARASGRQVNGYTAGELSTMAADVAKKAKI
jgi:hypothetical protein